MIRPFLLGDAAAEILDSERGSAAAFAQTAIGGAYACARLHVRPKGVKGGGGWTFSAAARGQAFLSGEDTFVEEGWLEAPKGRIGIWVEGVAAAVAGAGGGRFGFEAAWTPQSTVIEASGAADPLLPGFRSSLPDGAAFEAYFERHAFFCGPEGWAFSRPEHGTDPGRMLAAARLEHREAAALGGLAGARLSGHESLERLSKAREAYDDPDAAFLSLALAWPHLECEGVAAVRHGRCAGLLATGVGGICEPSILAVVRTDGGRR